MRRTVRLTKKSIQKSMDESGTDVVMRNRISWRKFDEMWKSSTLESHPSLTRTPSRNECLRCLVKMFLLPSKSMVLQQTCQQLLRNLFLLRLNYGVKMKKSNWSALARKYGLTQKNGGQSIKEFLKDHNSSRITTGL